MTCLSLESSSFYRVLIQKCTAFPLTFLFLLFEKPFDCFFIIQPEESPSIRSETSYPIASFWVAGDERELWEKTKLMNEITWKLA